MTYEKYGGFTYDKNGTQLKVGDIVSVEFRILALTGLDEQKCDLSLETVSALEIDKHQDKFAPKINVNSKQAEKIQRFSEWVSLNEPLADNDIITSNEVVEYFTSLTDLPNGKCKSETECDKSTKDKTINCVCGFDPSEFSNGEFSGLKLEDSNLMAKGYLDHISPKYQKQSHKWNLITKNQESWPKKQDEMYWVLRDGQLLSDFPCYIDNENRFLCKIKQLTKPLSAYVFAFPFEIGDEWCVFESNPPKINR